MSGSDVRDILELGKSCEQQQPRRVKQPTEKRPEGISRELYSLIGKASTVVLPRAPVRAKFNPKKRATPWTLQTCRNEARSDDLSIERWTKVTAPAEAVLHYQKFGESIEVIEYTDEEYETLLQNIDDDWTKEETDYLLHLCRLYRVRFPVIQDRYNFRGKSRPLEELKDRYFKICRILVKSRTPTMSDETIEHQYGYDKEKEIERRTALSTLWGLTRDQMDEEEQLLQETQRIEQNQARLARYKENAMQMLSQLDAAAAALKVKYPKKGQKGKRRIATEDTMTEEKMIPGVHVRSQRLPAVKPQYQTKVMGVMSILGVGPRPVMPTAKVCDTFEHLQNSITAMLELKKVVDNMEFEHNIEKSLRDSSPKRRRRK